MGVLGRIRGLFGPARKPRAIGKSWDPYDAASWYSQETGDWFSYLASPDVEINMRRDLIVGRIRDLVRNDGWASGAVSRILDGTIGGDLRLRAKPDWRQLAAWSPAFDAQWADEFGRAAEGLWRGWANDPGRWCDGQRALTMGQLFRLAFRGKLVDGESLAVLSFLPGRIGIGRARYATAVSLIDPDRLSNPQLSIDQMFRRGGVELDAAGAVTGYHIRRAHQGDWFDAANSVIWDLFPRETRDGRQVVIHDFDRDRPAQHRPAGGILTPVLAKLKMLAKYDQVELQAAVINSILAAYIESPYDPNDVASALEDDNTTSKYQELRIRHHNEKRLTFNGARIPTLYPGEKINAVAASRPGTNYGPFEQAVLRNVASSIGTSAEQLSQDWSKTNYSSARAALVESWKTLSRRRGDFAVGFASPVYTAWLEEAVENGDLPLPDDAPDFREARGAYASCEWMGPPRGYIDPVKEAQAAVMRMDAGISNLAQECAEQGLDYEDVVAQLSAERKLYDQYGIPHPAWMRSDPASDASQRPTKPQPA